MNISKKALSIVLSSVVAVSAVGGTAYGIKSSTDKKAQAAAESMSLYMQQSISESLSIAESEAISLSDNSSTENTSSTTAPKSNNPTPNNNGELESRVEELEKKHTTTQTEPYIPPTRSQADLDKEYQEKLKAENRTHKSIVSHYTSCIGIKPEEPHPLSPEADFERYKKKLAAYNERLAKYSALIEEENARHEAALKKLKEIYNQK